jgi:hypothetical protein
MVVFYRSLPWEVVYGVMLKAACSKHHHTKHCIQLHAIEKQGK